MEVQGKQESGFARRIHVCNYRAEERFNAHVISLVILTDENPNWRPDCYVAGQIPVEILQAAATPHPEGTVNPQAAATPPSEISAAVLQAAATPPQPKKTRQHYLDERTLRFLVAKLIDFRGREAELEALANPMGVFVVANLEAIRTRDDPTAREVAKLRLLKNLRQRNMDQEDIRLWTTCVDCFLQLAPDREQAVVQELQRLDAEDNMEFVGYIERQGMLKMLRANVIRFARRSCGNPSESNLEAFRRIEDIARLERLLDASVTAQSWEQLLATP